MKNKNTKVAVNREPDIDSGKPKRPFRGVIISGLLLLCLFSAYWLWSNHQQNQERVRQELVLEKKLAAERESLIKGTLKKAELALSESRWSDADDNARAVLKLDAENPKAQEIQKTVHSEVERIKILEAHSLVEEALANDDVQAAEKQLAIIRELNPNHLIIGDVQKLIKEAKKVIKAKHAEANNLYKQALALDQGVFSAEALVLLENAKSLHPKSPKINKLYDKMSQYTSVLKVPSEYATINEALAASRPRDMIEVDPGVYQEALIIDKPIRIKGSRGGKTVIELSNTENPASAITLTKNAQGSIITGLNIQYTGFDNTEERFSGITIQAKDVEINACTIEKAGGHGIAVIDGAVATISYCKMIRSGWDGISVYGEKSSAIINESLCQYNFQHGIEFWNGGSGSVSKSFTLDNNYGGIVIMSPQTVSKMHHNVSSRNREAGIFITNGSEAEVHSNTCDGNLLSGIAVSGLGTSVKLTDNTCKENQEAGIFLRQEVDVAQLTGNKATRNVKHQILKHINKALIIEE